MKIKFEQRDSSHEMRAMYKRSEVRGGVGYGGVDEDVQKNQQAEDFKRR